MASLVGPWCGLGSFYIAELFEYFDTLWLLTEYYLLRLNQLEFVQLLP